MSDKNSFNRANLLRIANIVKPALAAQAYIPALTHIYFDGTFATAYNDVAAIRVRAALPTDRCIPGDLLIRALGNFGAENITLSQSKAEALVLKSGRSTITIPTLDAGKFPLTWPEYAGATEIRFTDDILDGIERCLISVGKDATRPAHMGVTLDRDDNNLAVLFSTDNTTISHYQTKTKVSLPGDAPIILPRFFCEQAVSLARAYPEESRSFVLRDGVIEAEYGDGVASVFTKTPVDLQPLDFPTIIEKHCKLRGLKDRLAMIPDSMDSSLSRALLVIGSDLSPETKLSLDKDVCLMRSSSDLGQSEDEFSWSGKFGSADTVTIDPAKVARGLKPCSLMGFTEKVTILADADANFVHLVAHVAS